MRCQAEVKIGEYVAVIGLGLIGLITVQLLKVAGCTVIGLDISSNNFDLAKKIGCDECLVNSYNSLQKIESFTHGNGTDAVIITASTKSNEPVELSIEMARKKSKIVIVGAVKMDFPRSGFYEKELEIRQSCSYGPGRYNQNYEEKGIDYPIGYVRWTEHRNMTAILELLSQKKLDFISLVSHVYPIKDALTAYDLITGKIDEKYLGILIRYDNDYNSNDLVRKKTFKHPENFLQLSTIAIGFIGAGNFAQSYLVPPLKKMKVRMKGVATSKPINSKAAAKKFDFEYFTTDAQEIFNDSEINTVFIATHHSSHSEYIIEALNSGKNVFVEKPLAVNEEELHAIMQTYNHENENGLHRHLIVGFNRRFSKPFLRNS